MQKNTEQSKKPIFGLSTTPVKEIKSELLKKIEQDMMKILYKEDK